MKKTLSLLIASATISMAAWKPVDGSMRTPWAAQVTPENAWSEYPRPQLQRSNWTNLNGLWTYAVAPRDAKIPAAWDGEILVPFCPESALSGVGRLVEPDQSLWYRRSLPAATGGKRTLLHFEAVDYEATVWVNGVEVGRHRGGHTPFSFDISRALRAEGNELVVRVHDATEGFQLHGKQKLRPGGIWYTRVSGIWQTVWLEEVPQRAIRDLDFTPDVRSGTLGIQVDLDGVALGNERIEATIRSGTSPVGQATLTPGANTRIQLSEVKPWSPENPFLYQIEVTVSREGEVVDRVTSYAALREYGRVKDANGHWRLTLNGKPVFHWGPLDQGWWPDGLLTPPSDAAMLSDIEFLKACGFNMIRKHIKVEPRRYYHHCDRLGMMVWQDQVSMGYGPNTEPKGSNPPWTRMAPAPKDGIWPDEAHEQFVTEYRRMVDHLRDHPCVAVWVPFNEAWGQHRTMEVGGMASALDPSRAVNIASGGNFMPVGDIADHHNYPDPDFPLEDPRFSSFVKVVGEFGGHGWPLEGHLWRKDKGNWGYGGLPKSLDEWKDRFSRSIDILCALRKRGIAAGVYTQTTDVEMEVNGLLAYDRTRKIDPAWVMERSRKLLSTPDVVDLRVLLPTSEAEGRLWRFTTERPADGWEKTDFADASWQRGPGGFGSQGTPGIQVRSEWTGPEIWLRAEFEHKGPVKGSAVLRIHHDEDAKVFLNGVPIATLAGFTTGYVEVSIPSERILEGRNVLAIHCKQVSGGQAIDAGIHVESP